MKVGQITIGRWVSKLVSKQVRPSQHKQFVPSLHALDAQQLTQVSGGNGSSTQTPTKGW